MTNCIKNPVLTVGFELFTGFTSRLAIGRPVIGSNRLSSPLHTLEGFMKNCSEGKGLIFYPFFTV